MELLIWKWKPLPLSCPHIIYLPLIFQANNSHESSLLSKSPMAMPLSLSFFQHPKPLPLLLSAPKASLIDPNTSKRGFIFKTAPLLFLSSFALSCPSVHCLPEPSPSPSPKSPLPSIANTTSWFQYYGDGFSIRIPPQFEDITEPEDFNAGTSLYGDKAKPKTFAARFSSSDGSEVLSVVIRPTNQLKITFLEAQDVSDLGSLKEAARIFVPGGSTVYTARTIKIKEDEGYRTYYFYEFGRDEQHVALVAAVNGGKAIIAGATAPESKWEDDGVRLRSAAISLTVL